jgi:hypothetical protein
VVVVAAGAGVWALAIPTAPPTPMLAIARTNNPTFRFDFMTALPRSK